MAPTFGFVIQIFFIKAICFSLVQQPQVGFTITLNYTPHLEGLLSTSDQPDAETSN
jgi:hypothetical protein